MSIDRTRTIEWDGKVLSGTVVANGTPTKITFAAAHTGGTESADDPTNRYLPWRWNWGPAKSSIEGTDTIGVRREPGRWRRTDLIRALGIPVADGLLARRPVR